MRTGWLDWLAPERQAPQARSRLAAFADDYARREAALEQAEEDLRQERDEAILVGLDAPPIPGAQKVAVGPCHPGQPCPGPGMRSIGEDVLDRGIRPLGGAEVASS
jgi:hypothetical protein